MGRSFQFGPGKESTRVSTFEESSPFQHLIDAAGGGDLPGRWGLAQAVLGVWTQQRHSHRALHYSRVGLQTIGLIQQYRHAGEAELRERDDKLASFLKERKMVIPPGFKKLPHLVYTYSDKVPYKDMVIGDRVKDYVRVYNLGNGLEYLYVFWTEDGPSSDGYFSGRGPFVREDQIEEFLQKMSETVWEVENHSDLQLSGRNVKYGENDFVLSNIGDPADYVSDNSLISWRSVEKIGERCKAFQRNNISRKIIFYGSPGTGKSSLARNLARYIGNGHTLRIEASAIESAGTSAVTEFVNLLRPRVILFDDLDRCEDEAIEMLHYMEQAADPRAIKYSAWTNGLIVIGTANTLKSIDPALLRPGRFDEVIKISEPDDEHRLNIVKYYMSKYNVSGVSPEKASTEMRGFAPADIQEVVKCVATVGVDVFEAEIKRVRMQRRLYAGDACEKYLMDNVSDDPEHEVELISEAENYQ